ncbi:TPA_asm: hypothetical protein [Porphyromonas phage phage014a_Kyudai4]|uniref:Uncharacterized protein n=2 Tax=Viruses TaxID=10239 RepID=A0AAT9J8B5_9CAUD
MCKNLYINELCRFSGCIGSFYGKSEQSEQSE